MLFRSLTADITPTVRVLIHREGEKVVFQELEEETPEAEAETEIESEAAGNAE